MSSSIHGDRIRAGDRIVKINEKPVEDFPSLWDMNNYLKKELTITVHIQRNGLHLVPKKALDSAEYVSNKIK